MKKIFVSKSGKNYPLFQFIKMSISKKVSNLTLSKLDRIFSYSFFFCISNTINSSISIYKRDLSNQKTKKQQNSYEFIYLNKMVKN